MEVASEDLRMRSRVQTFKLVSRRLALGVNCYFCVAVPRSFRIAADGAAGLHRLVQNVRVGRRQL